MIGARIYDGDIVFIRKQEMVDDGEIAAVLIGDEATLKRVQYNTEENELLGSFLEQQCLFILRVSSWNLIFFRCSSLWTLYVL